MDMAGESVAGTKFWTISFSNHPSDGCHSFLCRFLDAGTTQVEVPGREWLGYLDVQAGSRRNMLEMCWYGPAGYSICAMLLYMKYGFEL